MGCIYPIKIENKKFKTYSINKWEREKYYFVPCGKCLGCQISKRTWLNTACNWEYNHYGCGSFTTLTYDDVHYLKLFDEDKMRFLGDYTDFQLFMKRLRQNIYRKYGVRHEFKYLAVGEYGGTTGRFHYHILFFGLDFRNNDLDIFKAWGNGMVSNLPIKTGGINYVLKYLDKSEHRRKGIYDFEKLEEPFLKHSGGLGKGFIEENLEDIVKNNGTYDNGSGKRHSLPMYWLNKLCLKPLVDYSDVRKKMIGLGYKNKYGVVTRQEEISKREVQNWLMNENLMKERNLINESRANGNPQEDIDMELNNAIRREML